MRGHAAMHKHAVGPTSSPGCYQHEEFYIAARSRRSTRVVAYLRCGRPGFPGLPRVLPAHEVRKAGPVNLNPDRYLDGADLLFGGQRPEKRVGPEGVVQHVDVNLQNMVIR